MPKAIQHVTAAINFIENHLQEKLDLETIAESVHYSKYHLHRMFTDIVGMTIQTYAQRRRLTEAAKLLVFSEKPILEIALAAGYESQQSFTDVFKAMYKKTPNQYREEEEFYPLQLRYVLKETAAILEEESSWRQKITLAAEEDIPEWMELVRLVIDGFPHLDEEQYLKQLREHIRNRRAWIVKDGSAAVGIMAWNEAAGSIEFLGVHPQYRNMGITKAFCEKALYELAQAGTVTVTTFREGDKADTGYRRTWKSLGFGEGELLVEFGYPTQRLILRRKEMEDARKAEVAGKAEAAKKAESVGKAEAAGHE